ncbi:MAG: rane protein of unknown function [Patescibacteria group bacterium]|nr:rane protein of unknown function [Patescibacteria group bacterium]
MRLRSKLGLMVGIMLALVASAPAWASLSQGFATTTPIASGSLVALDEKSSGSVVVADTTNTGRLFGVAVPPSSASISLSGTGDGQIQVVTSGTASVLVTTAGGDIKVGDYITVSSIAGVGQKVGEGSSRVIGTAQAGFNASSDGATKRGIDDGTSKREVAIGQIPVVISVSTYTATDGKQPYAIPNWLQSFSNTLAGKAVSPIRVIMAGLILMVALVSITVLLYAAVRNSIISIGRNPLSRGPVLRGLLQVVAIAAGILALATGGIYLVIAR